MSSPKDAVRQILDRVKSDQRTSLTAPEGKLVCDAYGIPVPREGVAKSAGEAAEIATGMGFPVVMKIVSPDILHKTEAGGVMVGVKTAADAAKIATSMGFPVVMKIVSPDILHKTEAGGVVVGVKTAADAEKAYADILSNAKKYKADAKIEGIQVQQMLLGGQEVIVGAVTDGSFEIGRAHV